jgi:hypothetical protein
LQVQAIVSAKDETIANLREHVADLRTALGALGKAESRADGLQTELDRWRMARHWWQRRRLRRARGSNSPLRREPARDLFAKANRLYVPIST